MIRTVLSAMAAMTMATGAGAAAHSVAPYGAWGSPISASATFAGQVRLSDLRSAGGRLYWLESRPAESGRMTLMTGDASGAHELTPGDFNVRSRVHEYGGAPYLVTGDAIYFSNFKDQRLYRLALSGGAAAPLTPEGYRYADCVAAPDGALICVRQDHSEPKDVRNAIVKLSGRAGDAGHVLFGKTDFVAFPRLSPDGHRLAFVAWDHPNMPWDTTSLYVADFGAGGMGHPQLAAGGHDQSVVEPQWAADGTLYFNSDASGFWNLTAWKDGRTWPLLARKAEFAAPLWSLGQSNFVLTSDGQAVARYKAGGRDHLVRIDLKTHAAHELKPVLAAAEDLALADPSHVAMIARFTDQSAAVVVVDMVSGAMKVVRRPSPVDLDAADISHAEAIDFPTAGGATAHALFYPPANGVFRAPQGSRPPLIVQVHGGPTSAASPALNLANQFWTSRGFAVVDVDHRGSSGYGRTFRQELNGKWGLADVEDVEAVVRHLVAAGRVDPAKVAIHGGSAGGYTVLNALSRSDVFKAGADYYGISDLTALAKDTHKFESRYLDNLIGPYPAAEAVYRERSALNHLDGFKSPLIVFQGAEDPVVPPNQAHMIVDALRQRGAPVAYLEFPGEGHGFRDPKNNIRAENAELYFYGRVFGFTPADVLEPVKIDNLPGG